MARLNRIKFKESEDAYYHIVSQTMQGTIVIDEEGKKFFLKLLKWLIKSYFVKIGSFSIRDNYVQLVIKMIKPSEVSSAELEERFNNFYNSSELTSYSLERKLTEPEVEKYYNRFSDLSKFMQDLKQRFSRWHNHRRHTFGHVWAALDKTVLLQAPIALLPTMIYVDLNGVRNGVTKLPENYAYCGLHHYLLENNRSRWLSYDILKTALSEIHLDNESKFSDNLAQKYLAIVYREGLNWDITKGKIPAKYLTSIGQANNPINSVYLHQIRHFSEGLFLGSKDFCEKKFFEFRTHFNTDRIRKAKPVLRLKKNSTAIPPESLKNLYSIRSFSVKFPENEKEE